MTAHSGHLQLWHTALGMEDGQSSDKVVPGDKGLLPAWPPRSTEGWECCRIYQKGGKAEVTPLGSSMQEAILMLLPLMQISLKPQVQQEVTAAHTEPAIKGTCSPPFNTP